MSAPTTRIAIADCPFCECDMVYPIDWEEAGPKLWRTVARCPNCEKVAEVLIEDADVEKWDEMLDKGTDSLVRDLRHLTMQNMADYAHKFTTALMADAILPEDFGR